MKHPLDLISSNNSIEIFFSFPPLACLLSLPSTSPSTSSLPDRVPGTGTRPYRSTNNLRRSKNALPAIPVEVMYSYRTLPWNTYLPTRQDDEVPPGSRRDQLHPLNAQALPLCRTNRTSVVRKRGYPGLTGTTVDSRYPTSSTNPVVLPTAIRARMGAGVKLTDRTCGIRTNNGKPMSTC
jgi:hypothetical protein